MSQSYVRGFWIFTLDPMPKVNEHVGCSIYRRLLCSFCLLLSSSSLVSCHSCEKARLWVSIESLGQDAHTAFGLDPWEKEYFCIGVEHNRIRCGQESDHSRQRKSISLFIYITLGVIWGQGLVNEPPLSCKQSKVMQGELRSTIRPKG